MINWKQEVCLGSGMMSLETLQPKEEKNEIWTLRDEESVGQCGRGRENGAQEGWVPSYLTRGPERRVVGLFWEGLSLALCQPYY